MHRQVHGGFNPLPPTVGGRSAGSSSITTSARCFNPLPPTVGGRSVSGPVEVGTWRFQSAPADVGGRSPPAWPPRRFRRVSIRSRRLSAGEAARTAEYDLRVARFNPLPPTVGGRRQHRALGHDARTVSIRSRRLSAGEGWASPKASFISLFQSAPADCRREKATARRIVPSPIRFQSAPADCRREKRDGEDS